jgi:putative phage-type endonuclease
MEARNAGILESLDPGELHPNVAKVLALPQYEQRTPPWYEARRTLITASDCAAALGVKPFATFKGCPRKELLDKKLTQRFMTNVFVEHGNKYEDEARDAAMDALGKQSLDFGMIRHPSLPWLGASPDGITTDGIMVEIKNPLRRKIIPGEVPHHYFPQVQVQMEVCDIEETLFIQYMPASLTKGKPFMDITWVKRDREWFENAKPTLKSFFDEYQAALVGYVKPPLPPPPQCFIKDDLYDA